MSERRGVYLFLTGADMDPVEVKRAYPDAQFIARGYTEVHAGMISPNYAEYVAGPGVGDVWGIILEVPSYTAESNPRRYTVTADDGRKFDAIAIGDRLVSGLTQHVYAAARYWELPPGYAGRLAMATPKLGVAGPGDDD